MKTVVFTAATKSYAYAFEACAKALARSLIGCGDEIHWVIATDKEETISAGARAYENFGFRKPIVLEGFEEREEAKYKEQSQLFIAKMQQACIDEAKKGDADIVFSVESDILVHPKAYHGLKWLLQYPVEPRYSIAAATYFNGAFLCGRGTPQHQIAEDFTEEERQIPKALAQRIRKNKEAFSLLAKSKKTPTEDQLKEAREIAEEIKKQPPRGNVFSMNAKKWRKRGWLDVAYPGAACQGAVLPSDWCGLGCTMWGRDVNEITNFTGYEGKGTQDLFLVWSKWHPHGKRIGCLVGAPAIHVKKKEDEKLFVWEPFFLPENEEASGHIRVAHRRISQAELAHQ